MAKMNISKDRICGLTRRQIYQSISDIIDSRNCRENNERQPGMKERILSLYEKEGIESVMQKLKEINSIYIKKYGKEAFSKEIVTEWIADYEKNKVSRDDDRDDR